MMGLARAGLAHLPLASQMKHLVGPVPLPATRWPRRSPRLSVDTRRRADDKTIKDYKITPGTAIHLVLALRGGRA